MYKNPTQREGFNVDTGINESNILRQGWWDSSETGGESFLEQVTISVRLYT